MRRGGEIVPLPLKAIELLCVLAAKRGELNSSGERTAIQTLAVEWQKKIGPTGINDHDPAILNAFLGDKQQTLDWLEKSVTAHHPWATWIGAESEFDFLRDEPRFQNISRILNLNS